MKTFRHFVLVTLVTVVTLVTGFAQDPLPAVSPATAASITAEPIYTLNIAPMTGATKTVIGGTGQARYCYWAVVNYAVGSVVSKLGCVSNGPNTLSGGNYISVAPFGYPAGFVTVDFLETPTDQAPSGTGNYAVTTGVTSGSITQTSNSLSSYSVPVFNPLSFVLTLTNESCNGNPSACTSAGATHLILRQGWPWPGTEIADLSAVTAGGCGTGTAGDFMEFLTSTTCGNAPFTDLGTAGTVGLAPTTGGIVLNTGSTTGAQLQVNGAGAGVDGTNAAYLGTMPYAQAIGATTSVSYCDFTYSVSAANLTCIADSATPDFEGETKLLLSTNITTAGAIQWSIGDATSQGTESGNISGVATSSVSVPQGITLKIPTGAVTVQTGGTTVWSVNSSGVVGMVPQLFSNLPACTVSGEGGAIAYVSDSTTNTWGATITGTGTHKVLAFCDSVNWTVAAI